MDKSDAAEWPKYGKVLRHYSCSGRLTIANIQADCDIQLALMSDGRILLRTKFPAPAGVGFNEWNRAWSSQMSFADHSPVLNCRLKLPALI
jgi:hypothetical protein